MSLTLPLFGDSLREAAKPWLEELGKSDRDRLLRLLKLAVAEKTRLSDVLNTLFYGEDTQTALANLTRLRKRLNDAAKGDPSQGGADLGLQFHVDTKKQSPPTERTVWFTGPDEAVMRVTRFSQQVTADVAGRPFIPSKGIATTGSAMEGKKIFVRFFVSYARANKDLADNLVAELKSQFGCSKRYEVELWMDQDTTVGDRWHERIQEALRASDFGLLLIGPKFLTRDYIREHELPHFMQDKKPILPVGLIKVDFQHQDLLGLAEHQIFRLPGKNDTARFYEEMSGKAKKREFAHQLFLAIHKRLDACFAPSTESAADTPACNEDEEAPEVQAGVPASPDLQRFMPPMEETRHFQRTKGYMHHLSQRESIDPALANMGEARDALDELEAWAVRAEGSPFFALLGEVGIGKTTTLKQFTRQLIEKRGREPAKYPLPIYIDLRDYVSDKPETVPTIEELLTSVIQRSWRVTDRTVTAGDLLRLVREEGALVIFDGLDEKIVHLTQNRARDFIRTLWSVLPQAMLSPSGVSPAESCKGKMLLSCRSHYFRDVWSQNAMLTGEDREGIDRSQYPAFCLLPFDEAQIRGYLTSFLGDEKRGGEAFELIASIHNLRDLAERPYLLSLISGRLGELEALQMRGETVNAARLYDLVVRSWLSRDDGKHHLDAMHKSRLMEALAAALWRSGEKQWDVDRLEEWFDEFLYRNPAIASAYANKDRALLKEDLRTATFVLRPDTEAKHFRFAHTSLQEYFLASYLFRALVDKADAEWNVPMVSMETLDFLGQILATNPSRVAIASLERILGGNCLPAACLAFKYWLEAIKHGHSEPQPQQVNLAGADLDEWHIQGRSKDRPLNLRGANLRGATLNRSRVEFVDFSNSDLSGLKACQALFLWVIANHTKMSQVDLAGLDWRGGSLLGAAIEKEALEVAELLNVETVGLGLASVPRAQRALASPRSYSGHNSEVNACAWHPHGIAMLSASSDGTLKLWDTASGKELFRLSGHTSLVWCCAWSPDGSRLLSGSDDNTLKLWDSHTGKELLSLSGHTKAVRCCAWSPDGSRLLSGSADGSLKLWDANTGRELLYLKGHAYSIWCCGWSPDGSRLLSGSADRTLKLWDANSGKELLILKGHKSFVMTCAWSPDGSRLLSGSIDKTLKLWDANTGVEILKLVGHDSYVWCCAWSPDGSHLLSGSTDKTLKIWDANTGRELLSLAGHANYVRCCNWSPDGTRLLSGSSDKTLKIWDAISGRELLSFSGHASSVWCCAWNPDGSSLLSGSLDNTLKLWDAASGRELFSLSGHAGSVWCCTWSPDGSNLLSGSSDKTLKLWDAVSGRELFSLKGHTSPVRCCAWSPDGSSLLSGSLDNTLKLWDAASGRELFSLSGHASSVWCCAWSPDCSRVLSGTADGTLKLWDAASGRELLSIKGHASSVSRCAWSPDGSRLLSSAWDNTLKLWDAVSGRELLSLTGHASSVWCSAWSPDGSRLLSGSADQTLKLWDAATGKELSSLTGHASDVVCCAWSPDGSRLLSGSWDNTLKFWDATTGQCIWTGHHLPENQSAAIDGTGTQILHATPEAWRWLGWEERDAKGRFIRRLPAEVFGPIPGMED